MSTSPVSYDPNELIFRTAGSENGDLLGVSLFTDGEGEVTFLLRIAPKDWSEGPVEALIEDACRLYMELSGIEAGPDWEFDYGHVAGDDSIWVPRDGVPYELEEIEEVFSIGEPPLGATHGRPGDPTDHRWVYVTSADGSVHPLKRLAAMASELERVTSSPRSWGRINYPLRDLPLFLRLTPETPRAAVLVSTGFGVPCHLRITLSLLTRWLHQQMGRS